MNWISTNHEYPLDREIVLVAVGIAMYRDGEWFTGMEEPLFTRYIEWHVDWWMPLPSPPNPDAGNSSASEQLQEMK